MLAITLSLSLIAFSQQDTTTKVKCLPVPVFKQIAQDLLRGDSCKAQLDMTMSQLSKTEAKVQMKDDIIKDMQTKEENYKKIIDAENQKFVVLEGYSKKLERKLKIEKVKNKFNKTPLEHYYEHYSGNVRMLLVNKNKVCAELTKNLIRYRDISVSDMYDLQKRLNVISNVPGTNYKTEIEDAIYSCEAETTEMMTNLDESIQLTVNDIYNTTSFVVDPTV